ncbi:hypothetical protein DFP72DRAFT_1170696 [Ephemerocybe angulata]|uniref:F-box domain-containing protein n=1 Tax=Ephemerocybe angulata TaxID=980116 RepID=A0A8H6HW43_9AGAR|nr:hypothetical protein DFP72DRAFT_1170696 [Tulosesus angulatus]
MSESNVGVGETQGNPASEIKYQIFRESRQSSSHILASTINGNLVKRRIESPPNIDVSYIIAKESASLPDEQTDVDAQRGLRTSAIDRYQKRIGDLTQEEEKIHGAVIYLLRKLAKVRADKVENEERLYLLQTPIRWLPQEILETIFLSTVQDEQAWPDILTISPLALTQVCSFWRKVAIRLPNLWTRFTFRIERPPLRDTALAPSPTIPHPRITLTELQVQERLDLWFQRSKPHPVSLCIRAPNYFSANNRTRKCTLSAVISIHSSRIEVLRIDSAHTDLLSGLVPYSSLTSLKRLELNFESCHQSGANTVKTFRNLPSITSIKYNLKFNNPFIFPVEWMNLTDVDLGDCPTGMSIVRWKVIVRCCTNLQRGRFFVSSNRTIPPDLGRNADIEKCCILPNLQLLTLTFEQATPLSSLFHKLKFPSLHTLELYLLAPVFDHTLASWYRVFRTLTSLRTLTISCPIIHYIAKLKQCLNELPWLECLKIKIQNDSSLFRILSADESACDDKSSDTPNLPILPRLRRLSVWAWKFSSGDYSRFWDMVETRTRYMHIRALDASALQFDAYESSRGDSRPFVVDVYIDKTKKHAGQAPEFWQKEIPSFVFRDDKKIFSGKLPGTLIPPHRVHVVYPYTAM